MKLMKLFTVLTLVGVSNAAFGYVFKFENKTNKPISISTEIQSGNEYLRHKSLIINPNSGYGDIDKFKPGCLKKVVINPGSRNSREFNEVDLGDNLCHGPSSSTVSIDFAITTEPAVGDLTRIMDMDEDFILTRTK